MLIRDLCIQNVQKLQHTLTSRAQLLCSMLLVGMYANMKQEEFNEHPVRFGIGLTLNKKCRNSLFTYCIYWVGRDTPRYLEPLNP